ncbi:MAG: DUF3727 domain-containing protein [Symploca sp. SIO2D2]|nr:DUF3727 domain-containing protein [Symploca sp. SIO2D2]NER20519.1 DUF3727 domain-containing protein [Symploca sp. SIO1C2]NER46467.1 DUF3727 domain-containing protein [Symploca sp. SIO1A3]
MSPSNLSQENGHSSNSSVTLTDEAGRSLPCTIEHSLEVEGSEYLLLMPVDLPIQIVAWDEDEDDEDSAEATLLDNDEEIDFLFPDARAVLAEHNLTLKHTAYTLTAAGELPDLDQEEILAIELEDEDGELEPDEFQLLASFYYEEQEYGIYTPIEPLLFLAQRNHTGELELLSPEEFHKVQPLLEDLLFDGLE